MGNVKESMQNFAVQQALKYIEGNPEENIPKLMALVDRLTPEGGIKASAAPSAKLLTTRTTGIS